MSGLSNSGKKLLETVPPSCSDHDDIVKIRAAACCSIVKHIKHCSLLVILFLSTEIVAGAIRYTAVDTTDLTASEPCWYCSVLIAKKSHV